MSTGPKRAIKTTNAAAVGRVYGHDDFEEFAAFPSNFQCRLVTKVCRIPETFGGAKMVKTSVAIVSIVGFGLCALRVGVKFHMEVDFSCGLVLHPSFIPIGAGVGVWASKLQILLNLGR